MSGCWLRQRDVYAEAQKMVGRGILKFVASMDLMRSAWTASGKEKKESAPVPTGGRSVPTEEAQRRAGIVNLTIHLRKINKFAVLFA